MSIRLGTMALAFLASSVCAFSSGLPESDLEKGPKSRILSFEKAMNTFSAYRPYLESLREDVELEKGGELRMRMEITEMLIGSGRLSEDMMIQLFRIERLFAREIASGVPDYKVEEVFARENMRELALGERHVSILKSMIKSQLFFDDPGNIGSAEKFLDLAVIEKQTDRARKKKPIPREDLAIKAANDHACLASSRSIGCLVTVKEFNAFLPYADEQTGRTVAESREHLLRYYAFQKLKTLKGREESLDADRKAIVQHVKEIQEYRRMRESLVGMGLPVVDEKSLQDAYRRHYREFFAERDSVVLKILASSDSVHVDSIHRFLAGRSKQRLLSKQKAVSDSDYALPWMAFNEKELPIELVAPTDAFHEGEFTKPIKTGSGYFLVKVSRIHPIPFVPFENAKSMCIFLATRDKYANLDSLLTAKAGKYYREHPDDFLTPDTSTYRFWLVPPKTYRNLREYAKDTARIKPMSGHGTDLPLGITKGMKSKTLPDAMRLHMADTKYGQMLVKLSAVKKGGVKIPFAKAKPEIVRKLIDNPVSQPVVSARSVPADSATSQEVLFTLGAGDLIFSAIVEETQKIPDSEIEAAVKSGRIDVSDLNPQAKNGQFYHAARKKMEFSRIEEKHQEIQDRLKDVVFNLGALSSK